MPPKSGFPGPHDLKHHGLMELGAEFWNLSPAVLMEHAVRRMEGELAVPGTFVADTGQHTGRSPNDKFVVRNAATESQVEWGSINQPLSEDHFERLYHDLLEHFKGREVYVHDAAASADPEHRLPIRLVTENAWHALFAHHMFLRLTPPEVETHQPAFTLLHAPGFDADPTVHGTRSKTFIILDFSRNLALIGGTSYAGEVKKTIFTVLNYLLPLRGVVAMHCSANRGRHGDTALYFGLSGTGKTTLSSVPDRDLIGDDEHGWSDEGIFNFEGGCYAKMIRLNVDDEPIIWHATHQFGVILENVVVDPRTRVPNFEDESRTENTRGAYPIEFVPNHVIEGRGDHPQNIFFLSADAFGVLPPIARLSPEQAVYYFLSGYTSKLAGTEKGLGDEPEATFSACFGAPFLPLPPAHYAELLRARIEKHGAQVWLVNTGWTGGAFGQGHRMKLEHTRAIVRAALSGDLMSVPTRRDPIFGLEVPESLPSVPPDVLWPRDTWAQPSAYDEQARRLARRFADNFEKYRNTVQAEVVAAGPSAA